MPISMIKWDEATLKTLTDMWKDGVPAGEISIALIGHRDGRSAVVGKANRMGLPRHANSPKARGLERKMKNDAKRKVAKPAPKVVKPKPEPKATRPPRDRHGNKAPVIEKLPLRELTGDTRYLKGQAWMPLPGSSPVRLTERNVRNQAEGKLAGCCWIVTQDSPWLYCNEPVPEGSKLDYCPSHLHLYHAKDQPKQVKTK